MILGIPDFSYIAKGKIPKDKKIQKLMNVAPFNKNVAPGKKPKMNKCSPAFILDSRVQLHVTFWNLSTNLPPII